MASKTLSISTDHEDIIHDAQLNYYGTLLATASSDSTVKIYKVENGKHEFVQNCQGHHGPVWQVRWVHPNFTPLSLVSCGYDRKIVVWTGNPEQQLQVVFESDSIHNSSVNSIDLAPHECGLIIAAASSDGNVSIYHCKNQNTRQPAQEDWFTNLDRAHQGGVNAVSWCKTSSFEDQYVKFASCGCDNAVCIWGYEKETGELHKLYSLTDEGHTDWVRDVAWAPSPAQASVSLIASAGEDNKVIMWQYKRDCWSKVDEISFGKRVWSVSWSIMGNILAVATGEDEVSLCKEGQDGKWNVLENV